GYFINDNIAVGARVSFTGSKLTPADTSDPMVKSSGFGVSLFTRYYVPIADNFYFYGQFAYGLASVKSKTELRDVETEMPKTISNNLSISPGFTFFPTEKFAFDMSVGLLGWTGSKTVDNTNPANEITRRTSNLNVNFNLSTVNFGILYFISN